MEDIICANSLNNVVNFLNSYIWGVGMLILIVGSGLYLTIRLHGFQFVHFKDMWSRIIDKQDSDSGISAFGSFCTTMAMRVGTGNVAGVQWQFTWAVREHCSDDSCRYDQLGSMFCRVYVVSSL
ncbi:MAG: alanine:cation symporter family protein [Coprococcus sp.]